MIINFFRHLINSWLHFYKNDKFPLTKEIINQCMFFNLEASSTLQWRIQRFFGEPISAGGLGGLWNTLMGPGQNPGGDQVLRLSKSFFFFIIKIYPPKPVMKLMERIFLKKSCLNSSKLVLPVKTLHIYWLLITTYTT